MWNKDKYPLFGGSVLDDMKRKVLTAIQDEVDGYKIETENIEVPLRNRLKAIYDNQVEDDWRSGYFYLKHI